MTNAPSTLTELNAAYSRGALNPVDLTNASLRRAEAENDQSRAFITIMHESALESAAQILLRGHLHRPEAEIVASMSARPSFISRMTRSP